MRSGMKQGESVTGDTCDLVHASSFYFSVTADVSNQVVVILVITYACCFNDVRASPNSFFQCNPALY